MRQILLIAAIMLAVGGYVANFADKAADRAASDHPRAAAVQPETPPAQRVSFGRSLTVDSDRRGHFNIEARVEGRRLDFVVDTGASLVTLRESDAARVGIRPARNDFSAVVTTANGQLRAARATLDRIEVGNITVHNVAALVLPDQALSQNLLGVSFLSRLRRYEYANGRLVMEQ